MCVRLCTCDAPHTLFTPPRRSEARKRHDTQRPSLVSWAVLPTFGAHRDAETGISLAKAQAAPPSRSDWICRSFPGASRGVDQPMSRRVLVHAYVLGHAPLYATGAGRCLAITHRMRHPRYLPSPIRFRRRSNPWWRPTSLRCPQLLYEH